MNSSKAGNKLITIEVTYSEPTILLILRSPSYLSYSSIDDIFEEPVESDEPKSLSDNFSILLKSYFNIIKKSLILNYIAKYFYHIKFFILCFVRFNNLK